MSNPSADSSAAYVAMEDNVYRSTTTSMPNASHTVLDSLKLFVNSNAAASGSGHEDPTEKETFLPIGPLTRMYSHLQQQIIPINGRRIPVLQAAVKRSPTMPISTNSAEETSLLGRRSLPADVGDDIELKAVQLQFPSARTLDKNAQLYQDEHVSTARGNLLVAVQGDRSKPAIITYHDLGLNHVANFQAFFNFSEMRSLVQNFCIYHVNAPGQEEGAATLAEGFEYPTMEELGNQLGDVMLHFNMKTFIGLGVGVGANILVRFALAHPEKVDALCLLNCVSTQAGWIEWGYQKLNARHLRSKGMTQGALDYLMWHHFGRLTEERNHDLVHVYREYFEHHVNPSNLALFIDSYIRRTDLAITRELDPGRKAATKTIKVPVLNMTGALSPHVDDTVTFNSRLDPSNSTWMKLQDCGMVLEEQPAKVVEAFRLFLQGNGYAVKLARKASHAPEVPASLSPSSTIPLTPSPVSSPTEPLGPPGDGKAASAILLCPSTDISADIRITENPISVAQRPAPITA